MLFHALILCFFVWSIDIYMAAYRNTVVQECDGCRTTYKIRMSGHMRLTYMVSYRTFLCKEVLSKTSKCITGFVLLLVHMLL